MEMQAESPVWRAGLRGGVSRVSRWLAMRAGCSGRQMAQDGQAAGRLYRESSQGWLVVPLPGFRLRHDVFSGRGP